MAIESVCITWMDERGTHQLELGGAEANGTRPRRGSGPDQAGKAWSPEQEQRVRDGFGAGEDAGALATELGRTRGAILARAVRLGLISLEAAGLRYPPRGLAGTSGQAPAVPDHAGAGRPPVG
jgi:hypothetical protein